jgi:hypothetical protein
MILLSSKALKKLFTSICDSLPTEEATMKERCTGKMWGSLLVVLMILVGSTAVWADDFYVIATGKATKRIVLVSPQGTATASGTALLEALSRITDASATNPYLIFIEPGIYDVGSTPVQMKSYVAIQGSGVNQTKIIGSISGAGSGTVLGSENAELRLLTVENGASGYVNAIYIGSTSFTVADVAATATGTSYAVGVRCNAGSTIYPVLKNVKAKGTGGTNNYGVFNFYCSARMEDVSAEAQGGTVSQGVYNWFSSPYMIGGAAEGRSGEGGNGYGVSNLESSPTMANLYALGSSGGTSGNGYGVRNESSTCNMRNVTIEAGGGTTGYGIYNTSLSTLTMVDGSVRAISGPSGNSYGVYTLSTTASISNSVVDGTSNTIFTGETRITRVGNTQLKGGPAYGGAGNCVCAGVYDEDWNFYASACP